MVVVVLIERIWKNDLVGSFENSKQKGNTTDLALQHVGDVKKGAMHPE